MPKGETITEFFPSRDFSHAYYLDHSTGSQQLRHAIQNDVSRNMCFFLPNRVLTPRGQDNDLLDFSPACQHRTEHTARTTDALHLQQDYSKEAGELQRPNSGLPLPLKQHSAVSVVLLAGRQMGASPGKDTDIRPARGQAGSYRITSLDKEELLENKPTSRTSLHREECLDSFRGLSTQEEKRATAR